MNPVALRRFAIYAVGVAIFVLAFGRQAGWWGWEWFWFGLFVWSSGCLWAMFRMNTGLVDDLERMMAVLEQLQAQYVVHCAGCRLAAVLMQRAALDGPPDDEVPLPAGWRMVNERPYCPGCLGDELDLTDG